MGVRWVERVVLNVEMPYEQLQEEEFVKYLPFVHKIRDALSSLTVEEGGAVSSKVLSLSRKTRLRPQEAFVSCSMQNYRHARSQPRLRVWRARSELILHLRPHWQTLEVLELVCTAGYLQTLWEFVAGLQLGTGDSVFPAMERLVFKNSAAPVVEWKRTRIGGI